MFCTTNKELTEQEKVTREWNEMAGEWDDLAAVYASSLFHHITGAVVPSLLSNHHQVDNGIRIVDFGCGTGLLTEKLREIDGSQVLAIDASPSMIRILREKIRNCEWENVQAVTAALGQLSLDALDSIPPTSTSDQSNIQQILRDWEGTVDLVVASNVMAFIPQPDWETTMRHIGRLLKSGGGIFCHSDWPDTTMIEAMVTDDTHPQDNNTDDVPCRRTDESMQQQPMTEDLASQLYAKGNLSTVSVNVVPMKVAVRGNPVPVFIGVAQKD